MKEWVLAVVVLIASFSNALAEERLRPADVLDPGMLETSVGITYLYLPWEQDFVTWRRSGSPDAITGFADVALGIGHDLEIAVGVPYVFNSRGRADISGVGDPWIQVKYALSNPRKNSFGLLAGLEAKIDAGGDAGTGTTDFTPWVVASYEVASGSSTYAGYSYTTRTEKAPNTHSVTVGLHQEFSPAFIVRGDAGASFTSNATYGLYEKVSSQRVLSVGATAFIRLVNGLYLAPSVHGIWTKSVNVESGPDFWTIEPSTGVSSTIQAVYFFK